MSDSATGRPETKALAQETLDRQAPVVDVDRKGPEAQVLKRIQAKQAGKLSSGFGIRACIIV